MLNFEKISEGKKKCICILNIMKSKILYYTTYSNLKQAIQKKFKMKSNSSKIFQLFCAVGFDLVNYF